MKQHSGLEEIQDVLCVTFDKTGTITDHLVFNVFAWYPMLKGLEELQAVARSRVRPHREGHRRRRCGARGRPPIEGHRRRPGAVEPSAGSGGAWPWGRGGGGYKKLSKTN